MSYSKNELLKHYIFASVMQQNVKKELNGFGLTKYSSIGNITLDYRKKLKEQINLLITDLKEDFNIDVIKMVNNPYIWAEFNIINILENGREFKIVGDEIQGLTVGLFMELINTVPLNFKAVEAIEKIEKIEKIVAGGEDTNISVNYLSDVLDGLPPIASTYFYIEDEVCTFKVFEWNGNISLFGKDSN